MKDETVRMSDDDLKVQRLVTARVCVIESDPDQVVLRLGGAVDEHCFMLTRVEFLRLAARFSQDSALLSSGQGPTQ